MVDQLLNASSSGNCTLWTPWGPQSTAASSPRLGSLRRAIRKFGDTSEKRRKEKAKAALVTRPDSGYEP